MGLLESVGYGIRKGLLMVFGPAQLDEAHDPVKRLEHEHEVREAQERGAPIPTEPNEPFSGEPPVETTPPHGEGPDRPLPGDVPAPGAPDGSAPDDPTGPLQG